MEFVKCLGHPEEFYNLLRFQMGGRRKVIPKMDQMLPGICDPKQKNSHCSTIQDVQFPGYFLGQTMLCSL